MSLVQYAREELIRCGQYEEDPHFAESIIDAVHAFSQYGHSGGSAGAGIMMLHDLLQFKPLSPITSDPDEWMQVEKPTSALKGTWQSRRQSTLFSHNGGQTWYDIDDPRWDQRIRGWFFRRQVRSGKV